jgi:vancomycin resistance protein YoaR
MAQRTTARESSIATPESFGRAADQLKAWYGVGAGRLRRSVLPDRDQSGGAETRPRVTASPGQTVSQRLMALLPRLIAGVAALLFVLALGLFVFRTLYSDRIYPAIVVGDVPVGGLTAQQAEARITDRAAELEQGTVTFSYGGKTWTPTLSELGATVEVERSVRQALSLGRNDDAASRFAFTGEILRGDQVVSLRTRVDQSVLNAWFDRVDGDLGQPAVNAQITVNGTDVSISPDATGVVVDREAATETILGTLTNLEPVSGELPTLVDQPEIRVADLEAVRSDVQEALSSPVRVQFEGRAWRIDADTLSQYLTVTTTYEDGRPGADLVIDQKALGSALRAQFAGEINRSPVDARVAWSDTDGLIALDPSTDGITLRASEFARVVSESFLNGHEPVDIPVVVTKPEIDANNLEALQINTRLGRGDSNFEGGSEARDTNIEVGVGLLNGTLVRPGEIFSFNGAIGEITADKGYVEASVVVAERTGKDIGGGICQVSTTVFRAALLAGMPIEEWHPHTYRIQGYERDGWGPGYDASILQLGPDTSTWGDFKFQNITDGWLLVEAWTAYPHVIVNIYGKDMGTTVEITDRFQNEVTSEYEDVEVVKEDLPSGTIQQTEWPMQGYEAAFVRVMKDKDGNVIAEREFYTHFKGRGNVYEVSPDMQGQSPAS